MVHKFRATASNIYHSSVKGKGAMVMAKDTKKKQVACCPTYSDFFEHFVKGLHKRMGNIVRPDWAISHEIVKNVLDTMEEEWETESVHSRRLELALEGAYYVLGLTLALRGEELTLVEMRGVRKYWEEATQHKTPHIVITLMGRLKNEICESYHLMPVGGCQSGQAQPHISGHQNPRGIWCIKILSERWHVICNQPLGPPVVIELNGRWRKKFQNGPCCPNITIHEHYTEIRLVLDKLLEFLSYLLYNKWRPRKN